MRYIEKTIQTMAQSDTEKDLFFQAALEQLAGLYQNLRRLDLQPGLWQEATLGLCQVDCRPANMLKDENGKIWLVDWEHAGTMDPIYEVAGFFRHPDTRALPIKEHDRCIRLYCENSEDIYAFEKMQVYQSILPVQWVTRILSLIDGYDRQVARPWVILRSVEDLRADVTEYIQVAHNVLNAALLQ